MPWYNYAMGYDMYWREKDPADVAAHDRANAEFYRLVKARDALHEEAGTYNVRKAKVLGWDSQDAYDCRSDRYRRAQEAVQAASEAMYAAERYYFRLNIWGMSWAREEMRKRGMLLRSDARQWPEVDYELHDRWEYPEPSAEPLTAEELRIAEEQARLIDEHLSYHGPEVPGIPEHKLSSNDGWIVTPAECEAVTRMARESEPADCNGDDGALWARWMSWIDGARHHGGFEVH